MSLAVGCDGPQEGSPEDVSMAAQKAEAQADLEAKGGKTDEGEDICEEMGWYGDGLCDHWCPIPDSDCGPCDYPSIRCAANELPVDTNETGCADTCVENPDYVEPGSALLGELCEGPDHCEEGAYCTKQVGRCDDGEPGVCTLKPECAEFSGRADIDFVCGCDYVTYANQCEAQYMGVNTRYAGMCEE